MSEIKKLELDPKEFVEIILATKEEFDLLCIGRKWGDHIRRMELVTFQQNLLKFAKQQIKELSRLDEEFKETIDSKKFDRPDGTSEEKYEKLEIKKFIDFLSSLRKKYGTAIEEIDKNRSKKSAEEQTADEIIKSKKIEKKEKIDRLKSLFYYDIGYTYSTNVTVFENVNVGDLDLQGLKKRKLEWVVCVDSSFGSINIRNSRLKGRYSSFKFTNCNIKNIEIYNSTVADFEFDRCDIPGRDKLSINILESLTGYFQFRACKLVDVEVQRGSKTGYFRVEDGSNVGKIDLVNSTSDYFRIKEKSTVKKFAIRNNSTADSFSVEESVLQEFKFESGSMRILTFSGGHVDKISLSGNNRFDMFFNVVKIKSLILKQCIIGPDSSISISDSWINYLRMDKFAVHGGFYLRNVKPLKLEAISGTNSNGSKNSKQQDNSKQPTFVLFHSSLGRTEFTNCDLEGFVLKYSNSNIVNTFIVGGTLPVKMINVIATAVNEPIIGELENNPVPEFIEIKENEPQNPYQKASLFNQLKKVLERGGDTYHSSLLQSEWADSQLEYLKLALKNGTNHKNSSSSPSPWRNIIAFAKQIFDWLRKFNLQTCQDILSFWLNKFSNKHDESWIRALVWILAIPMIFYLIFRIGDINLHFDTNKEHNFFRYWVELINPLNDVKLLDGESDSNGSKLSLIFLSKLFMGFFIYKFLRAFRKYGKK